MPFGPKQSLKKSLYAHQRVVILTTDKVYTMIRLFQFFIAVSIFSVASYAQDRTSDEEQSERARRRQERQDRIRELIRQQEEGALIFNLQQVYGLRLNTDGWGFFYEKGKLKTVKRANLFSVEFAEKRHPKEQRLSYQFASGNFIQLGTPYVYGKQNTFYQLKAGFGRQYLIGGKTNKNGVAIHWTSVAGPSIGIERPYYVKVFDNGQGNVADIRYTKADSIAFLSPGNIIQGTGLRYGWNRLKFVPGLQLRTALRFDYGRYNELVSGIEIGINAEFYARKARILLLNRNHQFFFNSYIAFLLGKRK
jgi:hypothetical protein